MSPKTIKPGPAAEQFRAIIEIQDDAGALASVPPAGWSVLEKRFNTALHDAQTELMEPGVSASDRDWLAGGAYHLQELLRQLTDLRTGQWKQWPGLNFGSKKSLESEDGEEQ